MSFSPVLPFAGYAGWTFLTRTMESQQAQFAQSPSIARDEAYFKENIGKVQSASELVSDYRLRRVALSAFGLQDDLPNRAFVERILSDGVNDDDALANRLADKRYRAFSDAFGFGTGLTPKTQLPGFADKILARFERQEFERAVGDQSDDMRLALTADRELPDIASKGYSDTTGWLTVMGNPPLRQVFETALGLPTAIGSLDLDRQLEIFKSGAERVLGSSDFSVFEDRSAIDDLIKAFSIRSQLAAGPSPFTPGLTAITLLQSAI